MVRGLIQYALHAKYGTPRNRLREMFDEYVAGFVDRAYQIYTLCPNCKLKSMKAKAVWRAEKSVKGEWKCCACGVLRVKEVLLTDLVDDFNAARRRT